MDTEMINKDIVKNTNIKSPEELITIYYNYPNSESKPDLKIEKKEIKNDVFEITLIHDNQPDDSQKAEKVIMLAKKIGKSWNVLKIRRNWKCYDGRGHTNWGTEVCN
jgi:hypothetical protein